MRTSDLAAAVGVHPNTVRLYEVWGFLPPVPRDANGYRRFGQKHLDALRLARTLLQAPYPGGKEPALAAVNRIVAGDPAGALDAAERYLANILTERHRAEEAAALVERWQSSRTSGFISSTLFEEDGRVGSGSHSASISPRLDADGQVTTSNHLATRLSSSFEEAEQRVTSGLRVGGAAETQDSTNVTPSTSPFLNEAEQGVTPGLRVGDAASLIGTTTDALRNWGRNGLYVVPRDAGNRYRLFTPALLDRLRVIRTLGQAGYSQMAILRMLNRLDSGNAGVAADPRVLLDTPSPDEDARYATDRWLSTLAGQEARAREAIRLLREIAERT